MTTPPAAAPIIKNTANDLLHFVEVLAEWLVPLTLAIIGLFLGPKIFNGSAIANALWGAGFQSKNAATQGANAALIGTLLGAGVIGVASGSLWSYQEGRGGWQGLISRGIAGFTIGWALGILVQGLNAYFVTGATGSGANPSYLDNFIIQLQTQAQAAAPPPAPGG